MNQPVRYFINAYQISENSITLKNQVHKRIKSVLNRLGVNFKFELHQFQDEKTKTPFGVTALYLCEDKRGKSIGGSLSDPSHITIHTWPEHQMFAMDMMFLSEYDDIVKLLQEAFSGEYNIVKQKRGKLYNLTDKYSAKGVGREVVGTFKGISNAKILLNKKTMHKLLEEVCKKARFKAQKEVFNLYDYGSSGAKVLTESHIALHYLRNENELLVDIFTCGEEGDPQRGVEVLKEIFSPKKVKMNHLNR